MNRTIVDLVESYILSRELAESSADYYRRIARVLCAWAQRRIGVEEFTVDLANRFLRDKQVAGKSCYYRKSLRNALRAWLGYHVGSIRGQLRPVKLEPLYPTCWAPAEVSRLIDACSCLRGNERQEYMRSLIAVAYYTGLSQIDLHRIERRDFDAAGVLRVKRSKTGKRVVVAVPLAVHHVARSVPQVVRPRGAKGRITWHVQDAAQVERHGRRDVAPGAGPRAPWEHPASF